jgi:N-acetylglucosaminyl-diphospho-decaprenol L-rhamnosyltransferase
MSFEVVIPHYNNFGLLRRTLTALETQHEVPDVCVVDNRSEDGSRSRVAAEFPSVRIVEMRHNAGFGGACNAGIRSSRAEDIILLNNDAVPEPTFIVELAAARARTPACTLFSPCLIQPDGKVDSFGIELDIHFNAFDLGHGLRPSELDGPFPPAALAPTGGAALFGREIFLSVGGFDEAMFAYLEDVDLGIRLRLAGAGWLGVPEAIAVHCHSATLGAGSSRKNYLLARNKAYLIWKYRRLLSRGTLMRAVGAETIVAFGKTVTDRNLGALSGWSRSLASSAGIPPVLGSRGAIDHLLVERPFVAALSHRRDGRRSRVVAPPLFLEGGNQ